MVFGATALRGRFAAIIFAGLDPLTGRRLYLRETAATEAKSRRTLTRLTAQVDEKRHAKTKLRAVRPRVHLYPAFGDEPVGRVTTQLLEEFYAELRRCSALQRPAPDRALNEQAARVPDREAQAPRLAGPLQPAIHLTTA